MTAPDPQVSTAPAEGGSSGAVPPTAPGRRRRLPAQIGPAHTSTVLLAVAFVAIGLLYLFVKPEVAESAGSTGGASSSTGRSAVPTTQEPRTPTTSPPAATPESVPPPTSEVAPTETPTAVTTPTTDAPVEPTEATPTTVPEEPATTEAPAGTTEAPPS